MLLWNSEPYECRFPNQLQPPNGPQQILLATPSADTDLLSHPVRPTSCCNWAIIYRLIPRVKFTLVRLYIGYVQSRTTNQDGSTNVATWSAIRDFWLGSVSHWITNVLLSKIRSSRLQLLSSLSPPQLEDVRERGEVEAHGEPHGVIVKRLFQHVGQYKYGVSLFFILYFILVFLMIINISAAIVMQSLFWKYGIANPRFYNTRICLIIAMGGFTYGFGFYQFYPRIL